MIVLKKVLIVDDAAFMRYMIKSTVVNNGYEVVGEAKNGLEAIKMYTGLKPDIVTMDITMPDMTGIEALKEIIKIDPSAKVIMVSAMGQEAMVKEAIISGAKNFIVKPYTETNFLKVLNQI